MGIEFFGLYVDLREQFEKLEESADNGLTLHSLAQAMFFCFLFFFVFLMKFKGIYLFLFGMNQLISRIESAYSFMIYGFEILLGYLQLGV